MVTGLPLATLRLEGAVVLATSAFLYERYGRSWILFVVLFFAPDVSIAGYLFNSRVGAYTYNALHMYLGPAVLIVAGIAGSNSLLYAIGLIWLGHIGFDRMLGYGLKYTSSFADTHLGRVGRRK